MGERLTKTELTRADIINICWQARDNLHRIIPNHHYKDYILLMLFLKYISDVEQAHQEGYMRQYDNNNQAMESERFIIPVGCGFYDLHTKNDDDNRGERINRAIEQIEAANHPKFDGMLQHIDFNSEQLGSTNDRDQLLKTLFEDFAKLDLHPSRITKNIIGEAYMHLIERFGHDAGKKAGEIYTPASVRKLVALLAKPEPGHLICDPTCGFGSLVLDTSLFAKDGHYHLYGQEKNGRTLALAKINMFLNGVDDAVLEWGDTLNDPKLLEEDKLLQFDRVVATPPFNSDKWGAENAASDPYGRFKRGHPPKSKGGWAFILHMLATAKRQKGRVIVVVPHGVLYRGAVEGRIRESLLRDNLLDTVIGLPEKLFSSVPIPIAVLVFDLQREAGGQLEDRKDILFIDASKECESERHINTLTPAHIKKIFVTAEERKEITKFSYLASFDEVAKNEFNLNIPRYVDVFDEEEFSLIDRHGDIKELFEELGKTHTRLEQHFNKLGI